jgi:putative iron-regulated protein
MLPTFVIGLREGIEAALIEVAGYAVYALPMLLFLLLGDRLRPRPPRLKLRRVMTTALVAMTGGLLFIGCGGSDDDAGSKVSNADAAAVATTYADLAHAAYGASVESAGTMQEAIDELIARPSAATLQAARTAWIAARDHYTVTAPFRFYGGPIDDPEDGPEGLINAWPMDEAYVDYVAGEPQAGLVNDTKAAPKITADVIVAANERGGETNISSGWHAIEFLLWGQDRSKTGPGDRPASDYSSAPNADRRADYLRLTTQRLIADLRGVQTEWYPQKGRFREAFLAEPQRALTRILRGIGALAAGELAGERMAVAFESRAQEDEHSCFSDNTNADVVNDIKGIRMVYLADFPGVSGKSLYSLVATRDKELAGGLKGEIEETLAKAQAFPQTFETMIAAPDGSPEREAMEEVIDDLEEQGEIMGEVATQLDLEVGFAV